MEDINEALDRIEEYTEEFDFDGAEQALEEAKSTFGPEPLLRVVEAELAFEAGDWERCLERVDQHLPELKQSDLRAEMLTFRAYSLFYLDREDEARRSFNESVSEDASLWAAFVGRAMVHEHMGYRTAALIDLDRAIELDDQEPEPFSIRGAIHLEFDNLEHAERDLGWAVEIDPWDEEARLNLARLQALDGRSDEAIETIEPLVEEGEDPDFVMPAALLRSQMSLTLGSTEAAAEDARQAIDLAPEQPWGYLQLAASRITAGDPGDAISHLKDARDTLEDPRDVPDIFEMMATAYAHLGKEEKAAEYRDKVEGVARLPGIVYGESLNPARNVPLNPNRPIDVRTVLEEIFGDAEAAPEGYGDKLREVLDRVPQIVEQNPGAGQIEVELPPIEPGGESPGQLMLQAGGPER